MVDFRLLGHSQCTTNPLNPPYQGDLGNFAKVGVISKCLLVSLIVSLIYHSCLFRTTSHLTLDSTLDKIGWMGNKWFKLK